MTTAPLERVRLRFAMLDTDANGYLEADDFEHLASRVIEAIAEPAGSAKATAVLEGHRKYWRGLGGGRETGHFGRIDLHEYIAHVARPEHFDDVIR
ncbi:calcium-binding protein, partial [Streptomyces anulatus]